MDQYDCNEHDLKEAAEFREEIHAEALKKAKQLCPEIAEVVDRNPVETYFRNVWDYPGRWYLYVAIPEGFKSRAALVDSIVSDTLAQYRATERTRAENGDVPSGVREKKEPEEAPITEITARPTKDTHPDDPFYGLISGYPDAVVDYCIVRTDRSEKDAHRTALSLACLYLFRVRRPWVLHWDVGRAVCRPVGVRELFSSEARAGELNYRRAFLRPPHQNAYTGADFDRVNAALFPNGTDSLEVCAWSTDWSDFFDDGHEWWGALCYTVYDASLDRFVALMASATD